MHAKPVVVGFLASVVATIGVINLSGLGAAQTVDEGPEGGLEAVSELDCPPGDLVYTLSGGMEEMSASAESAMSDSPEEALEDRLDDYHDYLDETEFAIVASDTDETQFTDEASGGTQATALTVETDGGWSVETFSACDSYLDARQTQHEGEV